jgi:hypothetical protein
VTRYDEYKNGQLIASLKPGKTGASDLYFTGASAQEPLGAAYHLLTLPLVYAGHDVQISAGTRGVVELRSGGYVAKTVTQLNVGGLMAHRFTTFVDPPLQEGGAGGASMAGEGGFGDAAVNCATYGAAIGAGLGTIAGGVVGAVGGATAGTLVGTCGGPLGAVLLASTGGVEGAALGSVAGGIAGGAAGAGVGSAVCMVAYGVKALWDWFWS